jgi:hypothetical protein
MDLFYWNPLFIRKVHNWELESMTQLLHDVYATKIRGGETDQVEWISSTSLAFQVKSYYTVLRGANTFPWQSIWKVHVLPRLAFFSCYVMLDKILTTDDLRKRGLIIMDWYIMCKSHGENVAHIFLQIGSYGHWFSVYLVFLE